MVADKENAGDAKSAPAFTFRAAYVVEQRLSNLAQGLLTLVAMTGPLLTVLNLIPQGVLAGLFFIMGFQALESNGVTAKILFLVRDVALTPPAHPLRNPRVRRSAVWLFVIVELIGFGATFAITQTVAAVGFPVFIFLLIPIRALLLPKWLTPEELAVLDAPTASPFTMESVGGTFGGADDLFLDGREGPSASVSGGEETEVERSRKEGSGHTGAALGLTGRPQFAGGSGEPSDEELAELGESRLAALGRRLSVNREANAQG